MGDCVNGYEKRTSEKKEAIITAARELFAARGVMDVSVTDIAEKANVSRVTIFKYFRDKETLAKEAMKTWVEILLGEFKDILASDLTYKQRLLNIFATRITNREKIGEQFINVIAWEDAEMKKLINDMSREYALPIVFDFIQEGRDTGYIDASIDNDAVFAYLSAFGPIIRNPDYIKKGPTFQSGIFNLFMGGLIKGWHEMKL